MRFKCGGQAGALQSHLRSRASGSARGRSAASRPASKDVGEQSIETCTINGVHALLLTDTVDSTQLAAQLGDAAAAALGAVHDRVAHVHAGAAVRIELLPLTRMNAR